MEENTVKEFSKEWGQCPVDAHVHMVGNGSGGSGCWLRLDGWHRPMAALMLRHLGLPLNALKGPLESLYLERLLSLVKSSSLGAVVLLAQDQVYDEQGRLMAGAGSFYVPNEYVLSLGRQYRQLLPAVSIHPARPDAMEELERCLAGGAVMMKCLPNCQNINCNEPRFRPFWQRMAEAGLPLLAHTGGEHTVPVVQPKYADPRILTLPLECGVTVIAAHCATKSGLLDVDYFKEFVALSCRYSHLYGDTSAFSVPIRGRHVSECLRAPLAQRMVHGSDFPVPVYGLASWVAGRLSWKDYRKSLGEANSLERDFQLKRALGFEPESFTRLWQLLRVQKKPG